MNHLFDVNWERLFVPSQPLLEIFIRGTCMYLALFAILRMFRRQVGSLGPADLLVLLLIADAAQNGMAGEYKSVTEGVLLVGTIVFWEYTLDWLSFRSPRMRSILEHSALLLVKEGRVQQENLQGELMTVEELLSQLRQKGVASADEVQVSFLESDGHVSVVTSRPREVAAHSHPDSAVT